ncbi:MAG: hypothetical protein AB7J13_00950 [Pyrinomonadaceae bacterium]
MDRYDLDNTKLDAIGKRLIKNEAVRPVDIDAIVSNPRLFGMVRERIAVNAAEDKAGTVYGIHSLIKAGAAAMVGSMALTAIVFGALSLLNTGSGIVAVNTIQVPDTSPAPARPVIPPQGIDSKHSVGRADNIEPEQPAGEIRAEKAVYRTTSRRHSPPPRPEPVSEAQRIYYPVSYTGDPAETAAGGQIIRVQMNRSSLFALGVNLPLENDDETVSADLVVGRDGVTRAIRVVYE